MEDISLSYDKRRKKTPYNVSWLSGVVQENNLQICLSSALGKVHQYIFKADLTSFSVVRCIFIRMRRN